MTRQKTDAYWLDRACRQAEHNVRNKWGGPFGAAVLRNQKLIALASNTVLKTKDPTCHAEINAIRLAAKKLKTPFLTNCIVYSTTEPCPMCFSALHWARVKRIVYSTSIVDVQKLGFNELTISNRKMKFLGGSSLEIKRIPNKKCNQLLLSWRSNPNKKTY